MADNLDEKLKQIADMFGVSDTEGLKNIVENIMPSGSGTTKEANPEIPPDKVDVNYSQPAAAPERNNSINPAFLAKAGEMMGMLNNVKDSRIVLLNSVQPFLGSQRQQRLGGAIQLLKVINIISTISPSINRNTKG